MLNVATIRTATRRNTIARSRHGLGDAAALDPRLGAALSYWQARRKAGLLPSWKDVDIHELRPFVDLMHIVEAVPADDGRSAYDYVFHLFGESHRPERSFDYPTTPIVEDAADPVARALAEDYSSVAFTGTPALHSVNAMFDGAPCSYSRLILPLAGDGRTVNLLLVLTVEQEAHAAAA